MSKSHTITPTVGRRLWYIASKFDLSGHASPLAVSDRTQPLDAGIAYVHSDRLINISVADQNGVSHSRTSVTLYQSGESIPVDGGYCVWMDYQVQQAAKEAGSTQADNDKTAHVARVTDAEIEAVIVTKGLTAPRITVEDIEANIAGEYYLTGAEIANAPQAFVKPWPVTQTDLVNLNRLTLCILRLRNGYLVMGESACVSPENFNAKRGREAARQDAVEKIWPLMGFELRSKLAAATELSNN